MGLGAFVSGLEAVLICLLSMEVLGGSCLFHASIYSSTASFTVVHSDGEVRAVLGIVPAFLAPFCMAIQGKVRTFNVKHALRTSDIWIFIGNFGSGMLVGGCAQPQWYPVLVVGASL